MKRADIRDSFHQLIDEIDNENLLMKFYDLLVKSKDGKEGEIWNQLSDEQKNELLVAEEESKYEKNLIDHESQKIKHQKWL